MKNSISTRDRIILSAVGLFNRQGYRATSLSDITKATGVTKGAVYGNFDNKDAVAVASFDYAVNLILSEIRVEIRQAQTAPLKLKAMTGYYGNYVQNPPIQGGCPVINTAIEADDNYPLLRSKVIRVITIIKESINKIIHRGIIEGQIKEQTNVEEFSSTFYASIKGAILISRTEGDILTYNQVEKFLNQQIDNITKK